LGPVVLPIRSVRCLPAVPHCRACRRAAAACRCLPAWVFCLPACLPLVAACLSCFLRLPLQIPACLQPLFSRVGRYACVPGFSATRSAAVNSFLLPFLPACRLAPACLHSAAFCLPDLRCSGYLLPPFLPAVRSADFCCLGASCAWVIIPGCLPAVFCCSLPFLPFGFRFSPLPFVSASYNVYTLKRISQHADASAVSAAF